MAAKKKNNALTYLLIGLVVVCVTLVITEVYTNTYQEIQLNGSQSEFMVNSDELPDYTRYTPAPDSISDPQATMDTEADKYEDTGE